MIRRRILFIFLPTLALLCLTAALAWLTRTESGARWIWNRVAATTSVLSAGSITGDLHSGLEIRNLKWSDGETTVHADRTRLSAALDLLPPAVGVEFLRVGRLAIDTTGTTVDPADAPVDLANLLESLALPIPVRFNEVRLQSLTVNPRPQSGPGSSTPAESIPEASDLRFSGRWRDSLRLDDLQFNRPGWGRVRATVRLDLKRPFAAEAELRLQTVNPGSPAARSQPDATAAPEPAYMVALEGDLTALRIEARAEHAGMVATGTVTDILSAPTFDLEFHANALDLNPGAEPEDTLLAERVSVSAIGSVRDYRLEAAADLRLPWPEPVALTLSAAGDTRGLDIEFSSIQHPAGRITTTGRVDWAETPRAELDATLHRLDVSTWTDAWPEEHPLNGSGTVSWAGENIRLSDIRLGAEGTPLAANGEATVDAASGALEGQLNWRGLSWPAFADEPGIEESSGSLAFSGRLNEWTANGRIRLAPAGLPDGELAVNARGGTDALTIDIEPSAVLGGRVSGRLEYRWVEPAAWNARLQVDALHTGPLVAGYPGRISGRFQMSGKPEQDELDVLIEELSGEVRGRPVRADGRLMVRDGVPQARDLNLRTGDSTFRLNGNPQQANGLKFEARIASLGDLIEGGSGSLQGSGSLMMEGSVPRLDLTADGRQIAWDGWQAENLSLRTRSRPGGATTHRLVISDAVVGERTVNEVTLTSTGRQPLEQIVVDGRLDDTHMVLRLEGGIADWAAPLQSGWRGEISEFRADHNSLGYLELEEPAAVAAAASAARVDGACMRGRRNGRVCAGGAWNDSGGISVTARFERLSLEVLRLMLATDIQLSQRLDGTFDWTKTPGSPVSAVMNLDISAGDIVLPGNAETVIRTGSGKLAFTVRDGRLHGGYFDLPIDGAGTINSDFGVPDLSAGPDSPVDARIRVELTDLAPFGRLFPELDRLEGRISADLRVSGPASNPVLTGHATLVHGRIEHFASGLVLSDIQLAGAVYQFDRAELYGSFRAGEGRGSLKATLGFDDAMRPDITLALNGENLTLIDVPDLSIQANPDLQFAWNGGPIRIDGRLEVPSAELSPRYLPTATVSESPDLVIVAGGPPEEAPDQAEKPGPRIIGRVDVVLGEDVEVTLDRATANFSGEVAFIWDGPWLPIGDGSFAMTGEINAYGQQLRITEGRIRFPRKPVDNPRLSIRAKRDIYGNSQIEEAGVLITGTLKQPLLEAYTEPMTTQERALTLLVTGSDFDYDQGVGGVVVGMYVAPRLYVSYGIGLFDDQNVISARYDLKKGFGIKATSGQRETGADISYTIEN
ncbi:translocation/assembly module TamB domain-containing protein [Elongatibacter sediminis]|uniref:Translocation/assembly module TamB domain-containing protein n=1 Tax=Elongatibacter sediminis TaxID=3119006 RepID=A0AAW9RJY8_9GAMM